MIASRVKKAKQIKNFLQIGTIGNRGQAFSIWTESKPGVEKNYETTIKSSKAVQIPFGDDTLKALVFNVTCKSITGHCDCKGNNHKTVCYHGFFALVKSLKQAGLQISFYENVFDAVNGLNFGGSLVKVQSTQGTGIVWSTIKRIEKKEEDFSEQIQDYADEMRLESQEERVNLLRGTKAENEGID